MHFNPFILSFCCVFVVAASLRQRRKKSSFFRYNFSFHRLFCFTFVILGNGPFLSWLHPKNIKTIPLFLGKNEEEWRSGAKTEIEKRKWISYRTNDFSRSSSSSIAFFVNFMIILCIKARRFLHIGTKGFLHLIAMWFDRYWRIRCCQKQLEPRKHKKILYFTRQSIIKVIYEGGYTQWLAKRVGNGSLKAIKIHQSSIERESSDVAAAVVVHPAATEWKAHTKGFIICLMNSFNYFSLTLSPLYLLLLLSGATFENVFSSSSILSLSGKNIACII